MIINRHRGGDFMSFLGDLKKKKGICNKIFNFQKTMSPFGDIITTHYLQRP